jgi:hypothetical protein
MLHRFFERLAATSIVIRHLRGCKPKPPKIPSHEREPGHDRIQVEAENRRRPDIQYAQLNRRHRLWLGDRERFVVKLKEAAVPVRVLDVIVPAREQREERIAQREKRGLRIAALCQSNVRGKTPEISAVWAYTPRLGRFQK